MTHTNTEQPEARDLAYWIAHTTDNPTAALIQSLRARVQELEAQTAHMADLVELADYATKKLEASQAQRVPLTDAQIHDWWRSENSLEDCDMCRFADFAQVVRAFELKYGITQEKQG